MLGERAGGGSRKERVQPQGAAYAGNTPWRAAPERVGPPVEGEGFWVGVWVF